MEGLCIYICACGGSLHALYVRRYAVFVYECLFAHTYTRTLPFNSHTHTHSHTILWEYNCKAVVSSSTNISVFIKNCMFSQGIQVNGFSLLIPEKKFGTLIFLEQSAFPYMRKLHVFTRNACAGIFLLETAKKSEKRCMLSISLSLYLFTSIYTSLPLSLSFSLSIILSSLSLSLSLTHTRSLSLLPSLLLSSLSYLIHPSLLHRFPHGCG